MVTFMAWFFVSLLIAGVLVQEWLLARHCAHVRTHRAQTPALFAAQVSLEDHHKAADYTVAKAHLAQVWLPMEAALLWFWTLGGGIENLDQFWRAQNMSELWGGVAMMLSFMLIGSVLELPLSMYRTFRIEARFGFNRATPALFAMDWLKSSALALVIGTPLLALILWLMQRLGSQWWLAVWLVWLGFTLLMIWAFPRFIAPWFNKFTPLADEALRARLENLLTRNGFTSQGVYVMDGSKRSSHGNAFFTGFGANKRIVFFDTLLAGLSAAEIEAVLAHELGHFRRHHIQQRLALIAFLSLLALAVLGWLSQMTWFYHGLGVQTPSHHTALLLFSLLVPVATLFFQPLMAQLLRKHEFEADAFAVAQTSADDLIHALVKLYKENASTLTPDPFYSAFYDSHPPAPERIAHLSRLGQPR